VLLQPFALIMSQLTCPTVQCARGKDGVHEMDIVGSAMPIQECQGKVDLIYIDPLFDVGADFSRRVILAINTMKQLMEVRHYGTSS
jgi:hypothetical protein